MAAGRRIQHDEPERTDREHGQDYAPRNLRERRGDEIGAAQSPSSNEPPSAGVPGAAELATASAAAALAAVAFATAAAAVVAPASVLVPSSSGIWFAARQTTSCSAIRVAMSPPQVGSTSASALIARSRS